MRIRGEERERNASMGQPRFELGSRAPKARRIPGYPTAPCAVSRLVSLWLPLLFLITI